MRAKILLLDGVVVEADGTAQEIADLTHALRSSHQVAEPAGDRAETPADPDGPPATDLESFSDLLGPDPGDSRETWEYEEGIVWASPELDEEDPEISDLPAPAEAMSDLANEAPRPIGRPLDLVVRDVASQFKLLADPTRLQILTLLADHEHNVGELCEALGGMSQPAVSHHLALLRVSGLVTPSRGGKFNYYDLTDQGRTLTGAVARFGTRDAAGASALFRQASDMTRLQVLLILSEAGRNVGELCSDLGGMSQPAVSHHLALMRHGGLIEARKSGRFSYYSLREEGLELSRLIAPMMSAKARSGDVPSGVTSDSGAIDFPVGPDDWMGETPPDDEDMEAGDEGGPGGAPPAHMLCRRVLMMVRELHRRGYERLRVAPGLSPSGLHWRCSIVPAELIRPDHGAMTLIGNGVACYSSGQGASFFGWSDAERDAPVALADKFLGRFPEVAAQGRGGDPDYARWYSDMLRVTAPDGLIYGYADWELPGDHLPALGCTADVKVPLPPPGQGSSGD